MPALFAPGAIGVSFFFKLSSPYSPPVQLWIMAAVVPFSLLITNAAIADIQGTGWVFRSRFLVLLGTWSYAFYLVHELALRMRAATEIGGAWLDAAIWIPVLLCLSIVAAAFLTTFLERPAEKRLRPRRSLSRVPPPQPLANPVVVGGMR